MDVGIEMLKSNWCNITMTRLPAAKVAIDVTAQRDKVWCAPLVRP